MKDLSTRVASALFFLIVMLGGIFAGQSAFLLLFALIGLLCLKEFTALLPARREQKLSKAATGLAILLAAWPYWAFMAWQLKYDNPGTHLPDDRWLLLRFGIFWMGLLLLLLIGLQKYPARPMGLFNTALGGAFYITLPLCLFAVVVSGQGAYRPWLALGLLSLSWINDTGAYFIGSRWGRHKIMPEVSPGKSWEGWAGGLLFTLAFGYLLNRWLPLSIALPGGWLLPALLASFFGPLGDLLESALKRAAGVKDSGRLLPGHGGALDRFDAFLFHLPFTAGSLLLFA